MRIYIFVLLLVLSSSLVSQSYRTQALSSEIYTIEVNKNNNPHNAPIIRLNSGEYIRISFDRISDDSYNLLRYRLVHCDVNWKQTKDISDIEYMDGFNDNAVEDYASSLNTSVPYTHFNVQIPNNAVNIKLSGNYVVEFYEDGDPNIVLLTACFSVLDDLINIGYNLTSNTTIDTNKEHQQLSLYVNYPNFNIRNPIEDLKVVVTQNNRLNTRRFIDKPSFVGANKVNYENNRTLIFEAGNEYRRFELASSKYNGMNIAHIEYERPYYWMYIYPDQVRAKRSYSYDQDQNGRYFPQNKDSEYVETESDYFMTYFKLGADKPFPDNVYVNGNFTNNTFSDKYKMTYDAEAKEYYLTLLLKQGIYNYQYLSPVSKGGYSTSQIEGNYYETENEYEVLVYYRPAGQRYDSLIGRVSMQSRSK